MKTFFNLLFLTLGVIVASCSSSSEKATLNGSDKMTFVHRINPKDAAGMKTRLALFFADYFPDGLAAVDNVSYVSENTLTGRWEAETPGVYKLGTLSGRYRFVVMRTADDTIVDQVIIEDAGLAKYYYGWRFNSMSKSKRSGYSEDLLSNAYDFDAELTAAVTGFDFGMTIKDMTAAAYAKQTGSRTKGDARGIYVVKTAAGRYAANAGLMSGDFITAVKSKPIKSAGSFKHDIIAGRGSTIPVTVLRKDRQVNISLRVPAEK